VNLYTSLYQNIFFRSLDQLRGRNNIARLKVLRQSQYWNRERLADHQLNRLNTLLEHARQHAPFYADRLSSIKLPLQDLADIQQIPILTKDDIRGNLDRILCDNADKGKLELSQTGGSTGEPSQYYLDLNSKDWNRGSVYRSAEWADVYLGDKTVQMTGSHFDYKEFNKLKNRAVLWLQRYKNLPVVSVNDALHDQYYHIIQQYKPTSIWGYASAIFLFSQFIEKHYPEADFGFLKALITSSETLLPQWREQINQVFKGKKVFDHYGSREMYIASECTAHDGYHIHAEVILLEVVGRDGRQLSPGAMGKILVTDLTNTAFPFIRYEIGDVGIMAREQACTCGVTLPKLQSVEGRISDVLVFKDRMLTPHFNNVMFDSGGVDQYQVIQNEIDKLVVKIVKNKYYSLETESSLQGVLQEFIGSDVLISFDYVDEIEVPKSGKRRYVISNIGL
jgi:phenylacetate-CoA ligase